MILMQLLQFRKQSKQKVASSNLGYFRSSYKAINCPNLKTLILAFGNSILVKSFP